MGTAQNEQTVAVEGGGGDVDSATGDTFDDIPMGDYQQLPGLPPMVGQDGAPLIVPIQKAKARGRYADQR